MKKTNLLIKVLIMLILFSGLAFGNLEVTNPNSNSKVRLDRDMIQIDLQGQLIATSSSILFDIEGVGGWDAIQHIYSSVSTGNITTANLSWRQYPATNNVEMSSETITEGTPIISLPTGYFRYTVYNNIAVPAYVTASILISND